MDSIFQACLERKSERHKTLIWRYACSLVLLAMIVVYTVPGASAFDNSGWYWPVPDSLSMSRGYYSGHEAIDIQSTRGVNETVVAARSGTVVAVYSGCVVWDGYGKDHSGCQPVVHLTTGDVWGQKSNIDGTMICNFGSGVGVVIAHDNGVYTEYSHMATVSVSVGQHVVGGTAIGTMGSHGASTGRHLHFAMKAASLSSNGYPNGTPYNTNPYGAEYYVYGDWNRVDNVYYSREYPSSNPYIDLNAKLDGQNVNSLTGFAMCDVYINGNLMSMNVADYYEQWPAGTEFKITNIKAANGYKYIGMPEITGVVGNITAEIYLEFVSCGTLEISGILDGTACGSLENCGTCDIYVDDSLAAADVYEFTEKYPLGTPYEIRNIVPLEGKYYEGSTIITGIVGAGTNVVEVAFSTIRELSGEWQEADSLPGYIDPEDCEIQYKHIYRTTAQTSPGADWTRVGSGKTYYVNSGSVYESKLPLAMSDERLEVGSFYYHYCGANAGNIINYEYTDLYNEYHTTDSCGGFTVVGEWPDDVDSRYIAYKIVWDSGQWAGGYATCLAGRSSVWYRAHRYQDRVQVTDYEWEKTTEWMTAPLDDADSVRIRYRLKDSVEPELTSVEFVEITPSEFTLQCTATDDNCIAKITVSSWTDFMTENDAYVQELVPEEVDGIYCASATVTVAQLGGNRDCTYNVRVLVEDAVGNAAISEVITVYMPMLVRSSNKLSVPQSTLTIDDMAFEGDLRIGEVSLPQGMKTIGSKAFADCGRLVLIQIPESVDSIASDAFMSSPNVVIVCPAASYAAAFAQANNIPWLTSLK